MNKMRRKTLNDIHARLESLKEELEAVVEDERDYLNDVPENLQGSERYENAENGLGELEEAVDNLTTALDSIIEAIET